LFALNACHGKERAGNGLAKPHPKTLATYKVTGLVHGTNALHVNQLRHMLNNAQTGKTVRQFVFTITIQRVAIQTTIT